MWVGYMGHARDDDHAREERGSWWPWIPNHGYGWRLALSCNASFRNLQNMLVEEKEGK